MSQAKRRQSKKRIDLLLVERGLASSREKAQALILAGRVSAAGRRADKPGTLVPPDVELVIAEAARFVGRGGEKLDGALAALELDVSGVRALDVGASTGGFTDCLLQRGAAGVLALDVGRGQLDWTLRNDPRVEVREGINVRYLDASGLGRSFELIVVDVSFISLRLVLPVLVPLLGTAPSAPARDPRATSAPPTGSPESEAPSARRSQAPFNPSILALVKPQFEVGRGAVGRGGIVRDAAKQLEVVLEIARYSRSLTPALDTVAIVESPIQGAEGNREFFILLRKRALRDWASIEAEARRIVTHRAGEGEPGS